MKCKKAIRIFSLAVWQCLASFATSKRKGFPYSNVSTRYSLRLSSSSALILRCLISCGMRAIPELVFLSLLLSLQFLDSLSRLPMGTEEKNYWCSRDIRLFHPCFSCGYWIYPLPTRLFTRLANSAWLRALHGNLV